MKSKLLLLSLFIVSGIQAHQEKSETQKDKWLDHPNHLLSFKECKEVKDGVGDLLGMSDKIWKEIKDDPENEEKWEEVYVLTDLASNYSNVYEVWCKDMVNHRVKLRMMAEKKKSMKMHEKENH